jgi:hypothetical protein
MGRDFSPRHSVQTVSGALVASNAVSIEESFLGMKRPEFEADQSPPSSSEVRYVWNCTSTPQYVFMT